MSFATFLLLKDVIYGIGFFIGVLAVIFTIKYGKKQIDTINSGNFEESIEPDTIGDSLLVAAIIANSYGLLIDAMMAQDVTTSFLLFCYATCFFGYALVKIEKIFSDAASFKQKELERKTANKYNAVEELDIFFNRISS